MKAEFDTPALPLLLPRAVLGGILMGLANLVPGVSGGTMLLAAGVYTIFIGAVADLTGLRFRSRSVLVVVTVAGSAALGILLLAGPIKELVVGYRWIAYSLFIGLTLGGVPVLKRLIGPVTRRVLWAALAWVQQYGSAGGGASDSSWIMMLLAGLAGASAMILPGISGGYLLLILGQYIPILSALDQFTRALGAGDLETLGEIGFAVILPVGLGLVIGVAGVSNLLTLLLTRHRQATLGVLVGLLLGAVVGLWPFQETVQPQPGYVYQGQELNAAQIEELSADDYPTDFFKPTAGQIGASLLLIGAGFAATSMISLIERRSQKK